jgi:hypothetical protein
VSELVKQDEWEKSDEVVLRVDHSITRAFLWVPFTAYMNDAVLLMLIAPAENAVISLVEEWGSLLTIL